MGVYSARGARAGGTRDFELIPIFTAAATLSTHTHACTAPPHAHSQRTRAALICIVRTHARTQTGGTTRTAQHRLLRLQRLHTHARTHTHTRARTQHTTGTHIHTAPAQRRRRDGYGGYGGEGIGGCGGERGGVESGGGTATDMIRVTGGDPCAAPVPANSARALAQRPLRRARSNCASRCARLSSNSRQWLS